MRTYEFYERPHNSRTVFVCAGTDASAIVNCLHILARSLDARFVVFIFFDKVHNAIKMNTC